MSDQFPDLDATVPLIGAAELKARLDAGDHVVVLDTRRPDDFETWHVSGDAVTAINVPFTEFMDGDDPASGVPESLLEALPEQYDEPIVTCCAKGISSLYVAEFLAREGYDVVGLDDGMRGWAGLYESTPLPSEYVPDEAVVRQFVRPSSGCLAYLVLSNDEAMVVDPLRAFANEYPAAADEHDATLVYAADTHVHADHVSGVDAVADATDAQALVPRGADERGYEGDADFVDAGDELQVGDVAVEAVALPGHTSEMLGFRVGDVLLAGDTIFTDSVARPDLEAGDEGAKDAARQLYDTIQEVGELDDGVLIAPGHTSETATARDDGTYAATLGELEQRLPAFERDREAFVDAILDGMPPRPNNYERIIAANLGRAAVDDSEAFELELGPNNCAAGE
ncbi:MBL fold metallo-hydrolase [Halorubellus sp. JP-L1]|uniref:MBL fold metallo-hydrolase n=1 Tax=Halorubellus sp. JP-L1 TaxID=2715753 RepID=UPI0014099C30|nr:MBL fold metallo-hydrolase [Halorubellus sp. JP-L1]NHN41691.1 MBL fold metallo-hydrolase [Halorubellus sp. JP-L1]